jgi:hypothetical protein
VIHLTVTLLLHDENQICNENYFTEFHNLLCFINMTSHVLLNYLYTFHLKANEYCTYVTFFIVNY